MIVKTRKKYEKSFKLAVVQRNLDGTSVRVLADELDISEGIITRWRREFLSTGTKSFPGNGVEQLTAEQKEIKRLEKELAESRMETQILKKAIRIFSKNDGKSFIS